MVDMISLVSKEARDFVSTICPKEVSAVQARHSKRNSYVGGGVHNLLFCFWFVNRLDDRRLYNEIKWRKTCLETKAPSYFQGWTWDDFCCVLASSDFRLSAGVSESSLLSEQEIIHLMGAQLVLGHTILSDVLGTLPVEISFAQGCLKI